MKNSITTASPSTFYVEGAKTGDLVCPRCHELGSKFGSRNSSCLNPVHGTKHIRLVVYRPPIIQRPPDKDWWDRE